MQLVIFHEEFDYTKPFLIGYPLKIEFLLRVCIVFYSREILFCYTNLQTLHHRQVYI